MNYPKWSLFRAARMTAFSPLAISPRLMATTPAAAEISSKQLPKIFLEFFISGGHPILPSAVLQFDPYRVKKERRGTEESTIPKQDATTAADGGPEEQQQKKKRKRSTKFTYKEYVMLVAIFTLWPLVYYYPEAEIMLMEKADLKLEEMRQEREKRMKK